MTHIDIELELKRVGFRLTFDNTIINRSGKVTGVTFRLIKDRLKFINSETGDLIISYPAKIENVVRFLNEYWYSNVK